MLTSSQARNIAESTWGRGGTTGYRTNRKGAFYFSCSSHGGFVIDGRALTEEERLALNGVTSPVVTEEFFDKETGKVMAFINPESRRSRRIRRAWGQRPLEIYLFEEDCEWALPVIFADIRAKNMSFETALDTYKRWYDPSAHQLLEIERLAMSRKENPVLARARKTAA